MIFDPLWKAYRRRRKLSKFYGSLIVNAQRKKNHEEVETINSEFSFEKGLIDDEIGWLETLSLQNEAERIGIPFPRFSDQDGSWQEGSKPNTVHLSVKARAEIRTQIRREKRERLENKMLWISHVLLPIIGLIGAIMGLISLMHSLNSKP